MKDENLLFIINLVQQVRDDKIYWGQSPYLFYKIEVSNFSRYQKTNHIIFLLLVWNTAENS